jgi:hypothetical protein
MPEEGCGDPALYYTEVRMSRREENGIAMG